MPRVYLTDSDRREAELKRRDATNYELISGRKKALGITDKALSELLNVSICTVYTYIRRPSQMRIELFLRLADLLKLSKEERMRFI